MKNLIAFAISICFLLVFVGCESAMNVKTKQEADLLIVMEVSDTHIISDYSTRLTSGRFLDTHSHWYVLFNYRMRVLNILTAITTWLQIKLAFYY